MKKVRSKLRPTEIGVIKTFSLSPDDEVGEIAVQCSGCTYYYNNLSELCEKWEDYEEPKEYWHIFGTNITKTQEGLDKLYDERNKEIGNYFETEEEAEQAVEKLKAFKRLKDNGMIKYSFHKEKTGIDLDFYTLTILAPRDEDSLDLLFGGEE